MNNLSDYCTTCGKDDCFFEIDYCFDEEERKHYHRYYCSNCNSDWVRYEEDEEENEE